jgi:hypothetical protein
MLDGAPPKRSAALTVAEKPGARRTNDHST